MSYDLPSTKTQGILEESLANFTNAHTYREKAAKSEAKGFKKPVQILVDKASGDYLWDIDGNQYIDFQNGWATNPLGNTHPEVIEAVHEAHKKIGFHWEHAHRTPLAAKLAEISPKGQLNRINFEVSGTEAAESAAHLALAYKGRSHIITFAGSFHGCALGTKLISGFSGDTKRHLARMMGTFITAPYPFSTNIPAGMSEDQYTDYCLWYLENHIPNAIAPEMRLQRSWMSRV